MKDCWQDREEAGRELAQKLADLNVDGEAVVALPRGGLVAAVEIARRLQLPLDLVITRKIGHPGSPEYAIVAVGKAGILVGNQQELAKVDTNWLQREIDRQQEEILRREKVYLGGRPRVDLGNKSVIVVDDGVATGLTLRAAIPMVCQSVAGQLRTEVDELVALDIPSDRDFLGSISKYYDDFSPVEDREVIEILKKFS